MKVYVLTIEYDDVAKVLFATPRKEKAMLMAKDEIEERLYGVGWEGSSQSLEGLMKAAETAYEFYYRLIEVDLKNMTKTEVK